ncbi:daptide biosynthesis RiPP recognition protein [Nocardioides lijunqiniae]|uniref:daptide biosynthesis RiPP recognition protein n=1 Tax=Nocardioides lijunqiniae TaxID=2760832 RepID=UPI001878FBE5|nr:daptide biosynthesis RiPP recognition protein [Nocardioides lijunqiniae]
MQGTTRLIKTWATGELGQDVLAGAGHDEAYDGSLAVVLERQQHFDAMREAGLIGADTRAFVPGATDSTDGSEGPIVLGYEGSLSDPGGDVQIGTQFFMQTQDYGTSEYLSLIGATLVRVIDETDFETFLEDADRAYVKGDLAEFATHPLVRLCDVTSLGSATPDRGPKLRLYVDASGQISTSPGGAVLGKVGDDLETLEAEWARLNAASDTPCAVALAQVVPEQTRADALRQRPWLAYYHSALAAVRDVRTRGLAELSEIQISGFGQRLDPDLEGADGSAHEARPGSPVLMWTDDQALVFDPRSEKTFQMGRPAARLAERLLVLGSVEAAAQGDEANLLKVEEFFQRAGVELCVT